jgi:hypothetical protein
MPRIPTPRYERWSAGLALTTRDGLTHWYKGDFYFTEGDQATKASVLRALRYRAKIKELLNCKTIMSEDIVIDENRGTRAVTCLYCVVSMPVRPRVGIRRRT